MDVDKIVSELRGEMDRLGRVIAALADGAIETVSTAIAKTAKRGRKRRGITPAGRKRLAEAMKRRWAEGKVKPRASKGKGPSRLTRTVGVQAKVSAKPPRGGMTPAGRKRLSEMMKKRWAERRKNAS